MIIVLFNHATPKSATEARLTCVRASRIELEFGSAGLCGEGKTGEKPLGKRREQQQTLPTYDVPAPYT